jgi:UDP-N-acetylmuramyl tripeptide synthase
VTIQLSSNQVIELRLRVPGLFNVYNALSAVATAHALGIAPDAIVRGVERFAAAFGRFERVPVPGGGTLTMLLVKNPTGLNEVIRTLTESGVDLRATMIALNDGIADGRDVSWIWDADIEPLVAKAPDVIVSGTRASELAIRLVHAGAHPDALYISTDVEDAMFTTIDRAQKWTEHHHAYALLTYTAMLELRAVIDRKGWTAPYWEQSRNATAVSGGKS